MSGSIIIANFMSCQVLTVKASRARRWHRWRAQEEDDENWNWMRRCWHDYGALFVTSITEKKEKEWLRDSRRSLCSPFRCFILSITNARRVHPQNPDTINRVLCKTRSLLRHRCQRSVLIKINHFRARHKSVFNAMHQVQQSVWMDATSAANKITRINCIKQRERRQVSLPKKYSLA